MFNKKSLTLAGVVSATLLLTGCSKLNKENYDKLSMGMSLKEVEQVIGSHDECSSTLGTQSCIWGNDKAKYIKVSFVADAAVAFSSDKL
ncbi:DUF3862 domain-containing protein [Paraneptunicella aestuarii]|uniref:DUF3862 domain-containing protein n=1 Tax=Paraneptunicella aestuarii TaxID=2831148 RepID=UPI001E5B2905|nr:DUF3862 domain-containing protein [Paraneptunicella aestuarii]UAA38682.1 DUF3862 domain-containing protein [Paraneptunicella aestuarii]